jgi:hypothetical protein
MYVENTVQSEEKYMTVWHGAKNMRFSCRVTKAWLQTSIS